MRLLYTLRYGAVAGNCGGDLRLFFSTLNPADWKPTPAPIMWQVAGANQIVHFNLPSNDALQMNLNLVATIPGELYVHGSIQVTTSAGLVYGPPIGQAVTGFVPGHPVVAILAGKAHGTRSGVLFDVGFELAVPWNGVSADCSGCWWALWH